VTTSTARFNWPVEFSIISHPLNFKIYNIYI
jgi:hypothetical protein